MNKNIYLLGKNDSDFPPVHQALTDPEGLLAMGGNLRPQSLLKAYPAGIFPWFNDGDPILWWSPNPRMVIRPDSVKISRSMKRQLNKFAYTITMDEAFPKVIENCSKPRDGQKGTWINEQMKEAYCNLFSEGHAHSVEVWNSDGLLVGGLYGVAIDQVFFGESMFSLESNTSKLAMIYLCGELQLRNYKLLDCQVPSKHLESLGAALMSRDDFIETLNSYCRIPASNAHWKLKWQWKAGSNELP